MSGKQLGQRARYLFIPVESIAFSHVVTTWRKCHREYNSSSEVGPHFDQVVKVSELIFVELIAQQYRELLIYPTRLLHRHPGLPYLYSGQLI